MREIKFRAWDKVRQKMIDIDALRNMDGGVLLAYGADGVGGPVDGEYLSPLMQFTGLTDKNGKEIYEGDIVQLEDTRARLFRREIIFQKGCFGYLDLTRTFFPLGIRNGNKKDEKQWIIIGNIYENPELLKDGNNGNV